MSQLEVSRCSDNGDLWRDRLRSDEWVVRLRARALETRRGRVGTAIQVTTHNLYHIGDGEGSCIAQLLAYVLLDSAALGLKSWLRSFFRRKFPKLLKYLSAYC